ncbi:MAG TPA: lactate utilization protein [Candidatus Methylomirabilis sp.]|nr:lactate utilization protein [Candidatus Methylomirabilis sp.]
MPYDVLASRESIIKTMAALKERNISAQLVDDKNEALAAVKKLLPDGAEIMTGGSTTLEQIGFVDILKSGTHPWQSYKDKIFAEKDPVKQAQLRRLSCLAEYFLGSAHAVTEQGEILVASHTGSQLPAYVFTSNNVIWVVGAQKIVPNLEEGMKRVREYCLPREDQRQKSIGNAGSSIGKLLIFERENLPSRRINLIFVNEILGF